MYRTEHRVLNTDTGQTRTPGTDYKHGHRRKKARTPDKKAQTPDKGISIGHRHRILTTGNGQRKLDIGHRKWTHTWSLDTDNPTSDKDNRKWATLHFSFGHNTKAPDMNNRISDNGHGHIIRLGEILWVGGVI